MAIKTLEEKFNHGLGDIYDAEHQFLEAQQQMLPQATDPQVRRLLEQHIKQTEGQISVLEQVFAQLGTEAKRIKCQGAAGLVAEGKKTVKETASNPLLADLAIADAQSKAEHYEVSAYRGLVAGAEASGQTKIAKLLQRNLAQEEQTAAKVESAMPKLLQRAVKEAAASASASTTKAANTKTAATKDSASTNAAAKGGASKGSAKKTANSTASQSDDQITTNGDAM